MSFENYKSITLEDMMEYIEKNAPDQKEWFKEQAIIQVAGAPRFNYPKAKKSFCMKFMPELIPTRLKPITKTEMLLKW